MKIAFYLDKINTYTHTPGIWGDEIYADALLKGFRKNYPEHQFYKFGNNLGFIPDEVDIAIYFQYPKKPFGKKNIYVQQNYRLEPELQAKILKPYFDLKQDKDNKIATISNKFAKQYGWELLLPAVDTDVFYPVKFKQEHNFDVAYIGNNIKDETKTNQYLGVPAVKYGVFGNGFNRPITPKDSLSVYNSSYINLNFVMCPELDVLICRPYQIAGCKGFILSEWTESLEKNFGETIEYVRPGQHPSLRIKEVLASIKANPNKAKEQREQAYKIVKEKYNCEVQAKKLWEWINE